MLQKESEDGLEFENRLAPLEKFSLVTCEEGGRSFQMHRLVQMAIRSWLEQHGDIDRWKQKAAEIIAESLPIAQYRFWKTWEILLPHSEVALNYVLPNTESQLLHAKILDRTAWYLMQRGRYDAAWERCQRALDIRLGLLEDNVEVAECLLLRATLMKISDYEYGLGIEEAETVSRRAVGIYERMEEKGSRGALFASEKLAAILLDTGDEENIKEATESLRTTLASREQSLGLEDRGTLMSMSMLAHALSKAHNYEEAEQLNRKTLEIRLRVLGENDFETIMNIHNLAVTFAEQNIYAKAREFSQRRLELSTAVFGEEHPHTLQTMRLLSFTSKRQANIKQVEVLADEHLRCTRLPWAKMQKEQ